MTDKGDLLDFYSDMGIGYITIFVACIFGIFSILGFFKNDVNNTYFILLSLVYWILWLGGFYSLIKYCYYLRISNYILKDLGAFDGVIEYNGKLYSYEGYPRDDPKISAYERCFYKILRYGRGWMIWIALSIYFIIGALSWIARAFLIA